MQWLTDPQGLRPPMRSHLPIRAAQCRSFHPHIFEFARAEENEQQLVLLESQSATRINRAYVYFPINGFLSVIPLGRWQGNLSCRDEEMALKISGAQSLKIKTLFQGGAIAVAVIVIGGQFWPGYMLDSNAKAEADQARQTANDTGAAATCAHIYTTSPDGQTKLVEFRKVDSYRIGQDAGVEDATKQALKVFADAKIMPEPSSYRVKSECAEQLHKSKPATAAQLK